MRRIVNGLLYDTETAAEIVPEIHASEWSDDKRDFVLWSFQALFKTRKGTHFLTKVHTRIGGFWRSRDIRLGEGAIIPKSKDSAFEWCVENDVDPDIVRKHFGEIEEA